MSNNYKKNTIKLDQT